MGRKYHKRVYGPGGPVKIYSNSFTIDEFTILSSSVFIFILLVLLYMVMRPGVNGYRVIFLALFILFLIFNISVTWHKINVFKNKGIVIVKKAEVLFGPFESATRFFDLKEGMPVTVIDLKEEWYKIKRSDGKVGWTRENTIEKVSK